MKRTGSIGKRLRAITLAGIAGLFGQLEVAPAHAEVGDPPLYVSPAPGEMEGDLAPGAAIVTPGQPITVDEAVAMAIQHNLDVEVERFAPMLAGLDRDAAWGAYDPTVSADMQYDLAKTPRTSAFPGPDVNRDRTKQGGVEVSQLVPWLGAAFSARYEGQSISTRDQLQQLDERMERSPTLVLQGICFDDTCKKNNQYFPNHNNFP